jgi:hypothetical protein
VAWAVFSREEEIAFSKEGAKTYRLGDINRIVEGINGVSLLGYKAFSVQKFFQIEGRPDTVGWDYGHVFLWKVDAVPSTDASRE